jgi:cytochrome c oxidase subunit 2
MLLAEGDTRSAYDDLWWHVYAPILLVVFVLVGAAVLYAAVRFRRRDDELPRQKANDHLKEGVYVFVVACAVAVLVFFTFKTEYHEDALASNPALTVQVTAFQWQWRFDYAPRGPSVVGTRSHPALLVVPAGETIRFTATARDVIHSFWIPELRFKRDVNPYAKVARFDLVFPRAKLYQGRCAEFCGLRHADMTFDVRALPRREFDRWLAAREGGA